MNNKKRKRPVVSQIIQFATLAVGVIRLIIELNLF